MLEAWNLAASDVFRSLAAGWAAIGVEPDSRMAQVMSTPFESTPHMGTARVSVLTPGNGYT